MAAKSLTTLQAGRGFAALFVVLYHANGALGQPKYAGHSIAPVFGAGNSGVQFFFVLSGFVIYLAHQRDVGRPFKLGDFTWKRFRRIYPPLWAVLCLLVPVYFLQPSFGVAGVRNPLDILSTSLLVPGMHDHILGQAWTLRSEIFFYAVFATLILNRRFGSVVLTLWLLASGLAFWSPPGEPWLSLFIPDHLLFGEGMLICYLYRSDWLSKTGAWLCCACGGVLFAGTWTVAVWFRQDVSRFVPLFLLFGTGAALIILGCVSAERRGHLRAANSLILLGEASYSIYLIHLALVSVAAKLMRNLLHDHGNAYLFATVVFALSGGIVFHLLVEKPLIHLLSSRSSPAPVSV